MDNKKDKEIRYCKKCGRELVSTNKHKLCENCRRERNENFRNAIGGTASIVGGIIMFCVSKGKHDG